MCYIFELRTLSGDPAYAIAHASTCDEALADVREQLETEEDEEIVILAVHSVH